MRIGNNYLPQSIHKQTSQAYANKMQVAEAQFVDALNSDFISSWFYDKDDFEFDDDKQSNDHIRTLYANDETRERLEELYKENNPEQKDTGMRGNLSADNNVMAWAQSNRGKVLQSLDPTYYEQRAKELEQKREARKASLEFTRRNMAETENAYEEAGGSKVFSVLSGMATYLATPTGAAEMLLPLGPIGAAVRTGSRYARTAAGINRRAGQAFVSETAMVAGIESIIGIDEYLRNKELGMTDERIMSDAIGRLATPFLAGALRAGASKVIDNINLWGTHGVYSNNEKVFMRDVLISDGVSRQDAERMLQNSLGVGKGGKKIIKKNANSKVKAIADALENGTGYRVRANILTDGAKARLNLTDDDFIEVDASDLHRGNSVRTKYEVDGVEQETKLGFEDIQKERELESDVDFTPGKENFRRVAINMKGGEGYGKLAVDEVEHIKAQSLDTQENGDELIAYVKDDAEDLYGRNIAETFGQGQETDIKEMVSINREKFNSVRNEFTAKVKEIYKDGEASKRLEAQFYGDNLVEVGDDYLIDVNKLSNEAKLALAFPEMMSRQENPLPLLFTDIKGRQITGFELSRRNERINVFNRAKLDADGAFVLFNLKPEGKAAGVSDIFKGGNVVKMAPSRVGAFADIIPGTKGIIKEAEYNDDAISGLVVGGRLNEDGTIEGGNFIGDTRNIGDLIDNGIQPRVIHIPGKDFSKGETKVMTFYYDVVMDSMLTAGDREAAPLFNKLIENDIRPTKENIARLKTLRSDDESRSMADYMVNRNLDEAIEILENYDAKRFDLFQDKFADSLVHPRVFKLFNNVYKTLADDGKRKVFFDMVDREGSILPNIYDDINFSEDALNSNLVLLKNIIETDAIRKVGDERVPQKELDRLHKKYAAIKTFIAEVDANLKGTPAQWKVLARILKNGGSDDIAKFDAVKKALGSKALHNVKSVDDVRQAFNDFEPLPVNDEGRIVLDNKYSHIEIREGDDGAVEFVKTKELTWWDEKKQTWEGISNRPVINDIKTNNVGIPVISVLYKGRTHDIELNEYRIREDEGNAVRYKGEIISDFNTYEEEALLRAVVHKYENTTKLTGKAPKFDEVVKGEIWKHADKLGSRYNITKINDEEFRLTINGNVANAMEFDDFDAAKAYVGVVSREIDLANRDTDELADAVFKCTLKV